MWANLHLLFWLSLVPVATRLDRRESDAAMPDRALRRAAVHVRHRVLRCCRAAIITHHGKDSELARAIGSDLKGKISQVAYALAIVFAFVEHWISVAIYVAVAMMWFVPDRRIARSLSADHDH